MASTDRARLRRLLRAAPGLEEELALLPELVPPGAVCVDVGASYGTYAVALARLTGPGGHVHAFEPRPRSRAVLRTAVAALTDANVTIHPVALSDREGSATLVTPRRRWLLPVPGRTFLKESLPDGYYEEFGREFGGAREREVRTRTLDALVAEGVVARVDLLKIDVEGAELRVAAGGTAAFERFRPVVVCEIEDRHTRKYGHSGDDVLGWFERLGYVAHVYRTGRLVRTASTVTDRNNYVLLPS